MGEKGMFPLYCISSVLFSGRQEPRAKKNKKKKQKRPKLNKLTARNRRSRVALPDAGGPGRGRRERGAGPAPGPRGEHAPPERLLRRGPGVRRPLHRARPVRQEARHHREQRE